MMNESALIKELQREKDMLECEVEELKAELQAMYDVCDKKDAEIRRLHNVIWDLEYE